MKGLLIKDLQLLKKQKQLFATGIIISCMFALSNKNSMFGYMYMSIVFSTASIMTINMDQNTGGMNFLLTLPVSRSSYAKEKYILMLVMIGISWTAGLLLMLAGTLFNHIPLKADAVSELLLTDTVCTIVIHALFIPLELKYEAGKSRSIMLLLIGAFYVVLFAAAYITRHYNIHISGFLQNAISQMFPAAAVIAGCVFITGLMGISLLISLRIMKNKEF